MNNFLPVMLLKEFIILPNQEVKIELNNELTKKIIKLAIKHHNGDLLIVCPKDNLEEAPSIDDLPLVGVIGNVKSKIDLPNDNIRLIITGLNRVKVSEYRNLDDDKDILMANVNPITIKEYDIVEQTAIKRKLLKTLTQYINESHSISNSVISQISNINDIDRLTDIVASFIPLPIEKKVIYMEETDPIKRANNLIYDISVELEILNLDQRIDEALRIELEENQREYILKEKINYIKKELGEDTETSEEAVDKYIEKLNSLKLDSKTYNKFLDEINKLKNTNESNPEHAVVRNYLDTVLNLPWNNFTKEEDNIEKIKNNLDKTHYGLTKAKTRILEYIAVKKRNPEIKNPIICLVGPPGVGKTSFAMNVASSINREFYKISVGGLNDTNELIGNRKTYIGSSMGKVMQAIKKCGVANPVIVIDEIDKMVKNYSGDPASSLLDILDPEQNNKFIDNYVEEPFDLSKVMFILTANDETLIPYALYDRLEIIEVSSYTELEKMKIAKKYLIPNLYKEYNVTNRNIKIPDDVIEIIIKEYTKEAGVRELNRLLASIIRKIILEFDGKTIKKIIKEEEIKKYLGISKYTKIDTECTNRPGLVNGLAYTPQGGLVLKIESCLFDGKGEIITTGMLGDVISESCDVASSYLRSNKEIFKINDYYFENRNIHLHFLEGATPKDGPSAGVAITTSLLSLTLNKTIPTDVAMTGEITLRGDILEVGGIKEKIIGAYTKGITQIFIPEANIKNLDEIPNDIKNNIDIIPVNNYIEIFQRLFN